MSGACMICSRKLNVNRTISCNTLLKHTGRPIYEVFKQFLPQDLTLNSTGSDGESKCSLFISEKIENAVKANLGQYNEYKPSLQNLEKNHKLCFRCYRLVLGVDYHGYELVRLKDQITKLCNASIEKDDLDAKDDILTINSSTSSETSIKTNNDSINMHVVEAIYATDKELIIDENVSLEERFDVNEAEYNGETNLDTSNPVFNSHCNTKRKRKYKRLADFEYSDLNEKHIIKGALNINTENSEEIREEPVSNSKKKGPILCKICHKKFKTKKSFNSHGCEKVLSSIKKTGYSCKVCGIQLKLKQSYLEHIESCYKNIAVQCNHCPVKLPSAAFLPRHMEVFHEGEPVSSKEVLCDQCGRAFTRKESLDRHQATVHGISYGKHQCPQCGRMFLHTSLLAEHMRAHRGYDCDQCKKTFSCASNLRLHLRTHHQNKHLYQCIQCNKQWKFHTSYIYHLRKVHGVDRHKCSRCRQHFTSEAEFVAHNNTCHKGNSNPKNKENESRLNTYKNLSKENIQEGTLLNKKEIMDCKTINHNESSSLLNKKDLKFEPNRDCLPLLQPKKNTLTLESQENKALKNQDDLYSRNEDLSFKPRHITQELDEKDSIFDHSEKLMIEEIDNIGDSEGNMIDFDKDKDKDVYFVDAPQDEYVELLASEDIVVETCEEYPPDCQYVIIVEDKGQI